MTTHLFKYIFILASALPVTVLAQKDTTRKQVVDITSSYKPTLRSMSKLNASATPLPTDTTKMKLQYNIPAQNLFYTYQPISLRPLAYRHDSVPDLGNRNYVKIGIGNYSTPYVSARVGGGDGKKSLYNLYADYLSSKGKIKYQDYAELALKGTASYFTKSHEIYGSAGFRMNDYFLYGYDHSIPLTKADVKQKYQNLSITAGVKNITQNELGIWYNPNITVNLFGLSDKASEASFAVEVPIEKRINEQFKAAVILNADFSAYNTKNIIPNNYTVNNTVFTVAPTVSYRTKDFSLTGGLTPAVYNKTFSLLPNVYGEAKFAQNRFVIQAGFVGQIIKNSFRNLTSINQYINPVLTQANTRETELYGGIKGNLGKHFVFSAKAGLVSFRNLQVYANDTILFNSFYVWNEPKATNVRLHADIAYLNSDKFSFNAGVTFNGYTDLTVTKHAFGLPPMELNASARLKATDKLILKSDLWVFGGSPYRLKNDVIKNTKGGFDLSLGGEYNINKKWSAWLDINNLFNNKYERWFSFPSYGTNFLVGAKYSF